jgi:hypothetical protein
MIALAGVSFVLLVGLLFLFHFYDVLYLLVFSNIIYSGIFIDSLEVRQVVDNTFKTHIEEDKKELKNYERSKKRNI